MKTIKQKLPKNIKLLKTAELESAIAEIITNPNETWRNIKKNGTWYQNLTSKNN